jgi:hypothetical protein
MLVCPAITEVAENDLIQPAIVNKLIEGFMVAHMGRVALVMRSAQVVRRVGKNSALRMLPAELAREVVECVGWEVLPAEDEFEEEEDEDLAEAEEEFEEEEEEEME